MPQKQEISLREGERAGDGFKWFYDGKVLEAIRGKKSRRQRIFEVHVADLVIDEETGDIIEIHILPDKYEAEKLIEYLKQKKHLK
ncbi:MAG: hypothetical protein B6U89_04645 [Desulfurococcales archaeon ex4484_58]|nr:MAG: hypothetical protein B6U89_04645 [Desulfurococcales archaeon ex4484_58]